MALNQPRTVPYDFRVVEHEDIVWLYDDSSRTYICSQVPHIWAEPLYWADGRDTELPDGDYFQARTLEGSNFETVPGEAGADVDEGEAWDDAREEAQGNHLI